MNLKELQQRLYNIKRELEKMNWTNYQSLATPFFQIREIVERYFPKSNYLNDLNNVIYETQAPDIFSRQRDKLIGIVAGLLDRIDLQEQPLDYKMLSAAEVDRMFNDFRKKADALTADIEEKKEQSIEFLEKIQHLAEASDIQKEFIESRYKDISKIELLKQEEIFTNAAKDNKKESKWWLIGSVIILCIIMIVLCSLISEFCIDLSCLKEQKEKCPDCGNSLLIFELIRSSLYRVSLISLLVYFLIFIVKNYNAMMHNHTVNVHKANSFAAAFVMMNSVTTVEGKDSIMTHAANAIFSHQNTGYIGKDNEPTNPLITEKIIEKVIPSK